MFYDAVMNIFERFYYGVMTIFDEKSIRPRITINIGFSCLSLLYFPKNDLTYLISVCVREPFPYVSKDSNNSWRSVSISWCKSCSFFANFSKSNTPHSDGSLPTLDEDSCAGVSGCTIGGGGLIITDRVVRVVFALIVMFEWGCSSRKSRRVSLIYSYSHSHECPLLIPYQVGG